MKEMFIIFMCLLMSSANSFASGNSAIQLSHGCSPFESYDEFIDKIGKRNPLIPNFLFKRKFSEDSYINTVEKLKCNIIKYNVDGIEVQGVLIMPKVKPGTKLPVIVYNRGGNGTFGALVFPSILENLTPLALDGFLVIASQYRGHMRTEPEKYGIDEFGGKDVNDVHVLIDLVKKHPNADINNIFMYGVSRGGMMSYMVARERTDIKAMAVHAGNTNLILDLENRPEMEAVYEALIPNYQSEKFTELKKRSVMYWVEKLPKDMPILLHHGDEDDRVHVSNTRQFAEKLVELNHPHKVTLFEGEKHVFSDKSEAYREILNWFRTNSNKT
ncbi:Prolyl oligopeptidase family protein [Arsukibacterium tuosuense]|uniref:Prolyl oligopeptidase family protein n=2 Tax=Arsukibacterium tuosuense TaxID=1323745 RepID=A0A285ITD9_9GAMM|nr:Prolyl oligopeptidase family protein [Arsukibacterium tuosuense]